MQAKEFTCTIEIPKNLIDLRFLVDIALIEEKMKQVSQMMSVAELSDFIGNHIHTAVREYHFDPQRSTRYTQCCYTRRVAKLVRGMSVVSMSSHIMCIDSEKRTARDLMLQDKRLKVKRVSLKQRASGKQQWYMHVMEDIALPLDWKIFKLLDPQLRN